MSKHAVPSKKYLLSMFLLSLLCNSFGNALTVALNLGSALWTAAAANLYRLTPLSLSVMLFLSGVFVIFVNIAILKEFQTKRIIGNLIFMLPFSWMVGYFSKFLVFIGITNLYLVIKIFLDCLGVCLIGVGISLYQRVNWMLHPCDDMMQIIRFKFFKGNSTIAQLVVFTPPIVAIIICVILSHHIYAVNIGTIFALLFQGTIVGWADRHIFPKFKHQGIEELDA